MRRLLRNVILCVASVALALAAGTIATAQESDSGNVWVEIRPMPLGGVLSGWITSVDFGEDRYSLEDGQGTRGTVTIVVADTRGSASGWSVTITTPDVVIAESSTGFLAPPHLRLHLAPGYVVANPATGHPSNAVPDVMPVAADPTAPQLAIRAEPGTGAGIYVNGRQADLTIPDGVLSDSYQATIIVTITGAAPGD